MDDLSSGSNNPESALELAKKIKTRLCKGGFNMCKWLSNSKELMTELQNDPQFSESPQQPSNLPNSVMEEDQGYSKSLFNPCVLGQVWNPQMDFYDLFCCLEECRDKCYHEEKHTKHRSKIL